MHTERSFRTAVCAEHERLRTVCQDALERWRRRREEISAAGLSGKQIADELLRLQADYAKAYSRLEKHEDDCELCRFVSKIGGRDYGGISNAVLDKKRLA
jgi:hypothetical protein